MNLNLLTWIRRDRIIVFLLFIVLINNRILVNASNTTDSLLNLLGQAKEDSNKVNLLIEISQSFPPSSYEKAMEYCRAGLRLSEELNYDRGKLLAFEKLGNISRDIGEFDSAFYYIELAIKYAEITGDKIQQAKNYNVYGSLLRRKGYYSSAMDYHQKGLVISEQINDKLGIANAYIYMAMIQEFRLNYDTAIKYYYNSLRMYEELNNQRNIGVTLLNIGDTYKSLHEYKKANENYYQGLAIFEEAGDLRYIGLSNNKIGTIFSGIGKYDSALYHYRICKTFYDSIGNKSGIAHLNINIGNLYLDRENYDSALYYFTSARKMFSKMDFKRGYLNASLAMADLYKKKGQFDTALEIYDECQSIASGVDPQSLRNVYLNILTIFKETNNFEKAFDYQSRYLAINDSIFHLEKTKTITDIELKYEKEKDQARILALENENLSKDLSLRKRTNQRNIYFFSGIGVIVIILFIFIFYRQKARKDRIIADQKIKQLEEEKKLLAARFLVEGQEEERKRIAKDLHDGLGVLLSTAKMQFTTIRDKSPENKPLIDKATKLLEQATGDVRKISHNMMPGLLTKYGLFEAAEDLFDQLDETEGLNAKIEIRGDQVRLPENKEIMLYRIIQEMVNNTLKHAAAKNIRMIIEIQPEDLNIIYSDDGKGFDVDEKLASKSIGLNSIQSRAKFLNGKSTIESAPGEGTKYFIQIPKDW